ncbi:MAG: hypothetical protein JJU29_17135 [Verrucomicrobia bacterium]|nr:hypothetical protein [Verrucomicrobiota bacterium]MCH8513017.1 hypothetical protein [Kiritimatiellia bacterium]
MKTIVWVGMKAYAICDRTSCNLEMFEFCQGCFFLVAIGIDFRHSNEWGLGFWREDQRMALPSNGWG